MNYYYVLYTALVLGIVKIHCLHLMVRSEVDGQEELIYHTLVGDFAIPSMERVKEVYFDDDNGRTINRIMAYDNSHTNATAEVTAGGIGFTYVNMQLKSELGKSLDYDIGIYS